MQLPLSQLSPYLVGWMLGVATAYLAAAGEEAPPPRAAARGPLCRVCGTRVEDNWMLEAVPISAALAAFLDWPADLPISRLHAGDRVMAYAKQRLRKTTKRAFVPDAALAALFEASEVGAFTLRSLRPRLEHHFLPAQGRAERI